VIVLVPVSRFRVAYEIARGRPYSKLERRVLEAIAGGGVTLRALTAAFHLHERLLVESVVTLVNVGWVAVAGGAEATFVLTVEGKAAIDAGRDPVSVVVSQARPDIIVLERVTGQLARHADARSYRSDDLADVWQSAALMTPRIFRNALDEARVQKLLPRGPGEWIRWVGPITLASKNVHFTPVDVNDETDQVRGLPPAWHKSLASQVGAAARRRRARDEGDVAAVSHSGGAGSAGTSLPTSRASRRRGFISVMDRAPQRPSQEASVSLGPDDVLIGVEAHGHALATALDSAAGNLLIASPSIDPDRLTAFLAESADAVRRRVRIDILPGTTPDAFGQAAVLNFINRGGYQIVGNEARTLLRTGTQVTGSGTSLLLYDDGSGRLISIVGDHDWLGPVTSTPVSVRLMDPGVVGTLARVAASLWTSGQPGPYAGASDRWRHLASATEERAARESADVESSPAGKTTSVEVIIDDEHMTELPQRYDIVRVGRFRSEADNGQDLLRGLSLQLSGSGAELVTALSRKAPNGIS
jgi:hypothetical protein